MNILSTIFQKIAEWLTTILPVSPFTNTLIQFEGVPYLGYLNWFVPVGDILGVFGLWLTAYGLFLFYSIFLRWLKVISD